MKEISNKDVIKKLKEYFLEQDVSDVAYFAASMLVDFHRILNQEELSGKEIISLVVRIKATDASLQDFLKNGPRGKLQIHKFNSDEL